MVRLGRKNEKRNKPLTHHATKPSDKRKEGRPKRTWRHDVERQQKEGGLQPVEVLKKQLMTGEHGDFLTAQCAISTVRTKQRK